MTISRRAFSSGALSLAIGSQLPAAAWAQARPTLTAALNSIRAYGDAHLRHFNLPGMTLGVTAPNGFATVMNFGVADLATRALIGPSTLFQIGSLTKVMTALVIHQLAAEGRLKLSDAASALVPDIALPAASAITVQHLLDHRSGLPDFTAIAPEDGLWTGFAPGEHYYYSNTGYEVLTRIAERAGGKPLASLFAERIFAPLGMSLSRGAIVSADRARYAQGYEAADVSIPFVRGTGLVPAPWVDWDSGAGSVGSTAADMNLFLRALAQLAQARPALGLDAAAASEFVRHALPADVPGATYGNGLRHIREGGRDYFHHTGGMLSFSSAFHLDRASGVGAFASTSLSAFASYRPRLLTRFAADVMTNFLAGRALPYPSVLDTPVANIPSYIGRYSGAAGSFEIRAGKPLTIVADGQSAELQSWGGEAFRTSHPRFRNFTLLFDRRPTGIAGAAWGPATYVRDGVTVKAAPSDPALALFAGRYTSPSPWWRTITVVEREGRLWLGTETPLTRIGDNLWRAGKDSWSPERASFRDLVDGRPQTLVFSGETFRRGG
ncbi:beta-lactamase family protein [Sphingomonas lutea]|uniref:Beta-lactamase family protein n=1 Tax=Sphingomonas lutea TaxID=1045317 RepID=A0A7G9SHK9_9SPHN|nr:serine hydrolase domain-containing protein [Sphingomonas lutea]QNN67334.1 beta-lactamase family protein [Sphingomonas lutea]